MRLPDSALIQNGLHAWPVKAKADNGGFCADGTSVRFKASDDRVEVLVSSAEPISYVRLRWEMPFREGTRFLGDHWERGYGDLQWRGFVPDRVMPWYFIAAQGHNVLCRGVMTGPNSFCHFLADESGFWLNIDLRNGTEGVLLTGELSACTVVFFETQEEPFRAAQRFCRMLCPEPLMPGEPVYGGNNWYYAYGKSSQAQILDDTQRVVRLSPEGCNRPFMVIDDGWQIGRDIMGECSGGPWDKPNKDFSDMQQLAQGIKQRGAKPGIWLRPLLTTLELPHWRLLAQGSITRHGGKPVLDPTVPENIEQIKQDLERLADWGYELIKHDFTSYDIFGRWGFEMAGQVADVSGSWHFSDRTVTGAQAVLGLYRAIYQAAGRRALILGCNTFSHLAAGLVHIQRTGDDTSGYDWERTRKMGVNTLAFRMPQHGAFYAVDGDCVGLTVNVPWDKNRQWLDVLANSGTPLFISYAPAAETPERNEAVARAYAIAAQPSDISVPLDWMDTACPRRWQKDGKVTQYDWTSV